MFLKTLTLKGFKSFADTTTIELEPGITVVVGPNGSGKSNIVDAVAWVLGAQGPRTVRSAKMEDVIFAGTAHRSALGRAEVVLTIDNAARLIPIELSEVSITRTLWRSGESEYAINGAPCRLLDVQELLSDTGVGRQQHVIVSQGQLDAVLNAQPMDRRMIVEEAAGVLKFRRRREKAQRRLESTEANLLRVQDLLREVRRQLRPLERQADAARRHGDVVAELRALRLFLAGRELAGLRSRAAAVAGVRADQGAAQRALEERLAELDAEVSTAEAALVVADQGDDLSSGPSEWGTGWSGWPGPRPGSSDRPEWAANPVGIAHVGGDGPASGAAVGLRGGPRRARRDRLADDVARAEGLRERVRGLAAVVAERSRSLERLRSFEMEAGVVAALEAEATDLVAQMHAVEAEAERLAPEADDLAVAEAELAAERASLEADGDEPTARPSDDRGRHPAGGGVGTRAPLGGGTKSPRSAGAAEVRGELAALTSAADRAGAEQRRSEERQAVLATKAERLAAEAAELSDELERAERDALAFAEAAAGATAARVASEADLDAAEQAFATASSDRRSWSSRADALAQALDEARARAGAARLRSLDGLVGTLLDVVDVDAGWEPAFEAAIGEAVAAVVVDGVDAARRALAHLHAAGHSGAVLALGAADRTGGADGWEAAVPGADSGTTGAREVAHGPGATGTGEVADPPAGTEPVRAHVRSAIPAVAALLDRLLVGAVAVEGPWSDALDVVLDHPGLVVVTRSGDRFAAAGWRAGVGGAGATGAALEEARNRAEAADAGLAAAASARSAARQVAAAARLAEADAWRAVDRHASRRAQAAADLQRAQGERRELADEVQAAAAHLSELVVRRARDDARMAELASALPGLEAEEAAGLERAAAQRAARGRIEAREAALRALRTDLEVRAAGLEERRALLGRRQAEVEGRLGRHRVEREAAEHRRIELTGQVMAVARLTRVLAVRADQVDGVLGRLREERRIHAERTAALTGRLEDLRRQRTAAERDLAGARERLQRAELDDAEIRVRTEAATETLRRDLDCEPETATAAVCPPLPSGATAEQRARELERDVRLMGPINPLAVEEHAALVERHQFLEDQLEDVKAGRRELAKVIRAIDTEIVDVFSAAYADVADNFSTLFAMLFPGGTGRLRLTDPNDPLETGIEVEARPSGKNVKRLSLLSGGERSLTAMAFLFAVFRSRPSPFYLMDEVEAALDDVNLHRFLDLIREFRTEAQLVIVSHQRRTMEAADCLYGVTMQPGGSSRVVSERVGAGTG